QREASIEIRDTLFHHLSFMGASSLKSSHVPGSGTSMKGKGAGTGSLKNLSEANPLLAKTRRSLIVEAGSPQAYNWGQPIY
ncbi:MAG: hypothetical protein QXE79_05605, partial [Candidatus Bathyarchaeia archaeon]